MKTKTWFLLAIALCAVAAVYMGCSRAEARGKLQIMYSGNLRGSVAPCGCKVPKGGLARRAEFLSRHRDVNSNWLTVDAGNFVDKSGGQGGCTNKCQFTIFAYEDLHYDVLNIGRQEVSMGKQTLLSILDTLRGTQCISANLLDRKSGDLICKPYVIKDYGNMKVGIVGLLNDQDFNRSASPTDSADFAVTPYGDALKKSLSALTRKTDSIVLLCDLSSTVLDSILPLFPDIDLVISSGSLRTGEQATKVGHAQVVGTGSSGYNGCCCTMEFNPTWSDSIAFTHYMDALTEAYDTQGLWADRIAQFQTNPPPAAPIPAQSVGISSATSVNPRGAAPSAKEIPLPTNVSSTQPVNAQKSGGH